MEANFLWREALKTRRAIRDEAIKIESGVMRREAVMKTRLVSGSYRLSKTKEKLEKRKEHLA